MSQQFERSGVELVLDSKQYNANVASVIRDAGRVDASMNDIIDAANRAERALNGVNGDVNVDVVVNDQEVHTTQGLIDGLTQTENVGVTVNDGQIDTAQTDIDNLTQTENVDVNVDTGDVKTALDTVKADLDTLKKLAVVDVVLNVANFAKGIPELPVVSSIVEANDAIQKLEGTTGRVIPGAADLINNVYNSAWGDSKEAIAEVITEASKLAISSDKLGDAVTTAFQVSDTGIGDTTEILRTMDSLVKNKLSPDFKSAGDLIVTGLQNGADRGQDLLDTFNEYGSTFAELKISGPGALALITSGLKVGVDNSDRIADAIRETGIRLREIGTDKNIADAFKQLDDLSDVDLQGLLDAYNAGDISGDQFFTGFFDSLKQANQKDPQKASQIAATLVGTISEDFGPEAISQLSPKWDETMGALEGRAATASNTINNTLGTAITGLARTIETEVATTLDDAFDIQGIIDKVKEAVPQIAQAIQEGSSISEAIEIGFDLEGSPLQNIESMFNNIAIVFMQAMQSVLSVLGKSKEAEDLGKEIARISGGQLAFDLKLATDSEDVGDTLQRALERGVRGGDLATGVQTALDEALAAGNFDLAATLMKGAQDWATDPGFDLIFEQMGVRAENVMRPAFEDAMASGDFAGAKTIADALDDPALQQKVSELGIQLIESFNSAMSTGDFDLAGAIAGQLGNEPLGIQVDFEKALSEGNLGEALKQISLADDPSVKEGMQTQADALAAQLNASFTSAVQSGDFDTAAVIAEQIGDPELIEQVRSLGGAFGETATQAQTGASTTALAMDDTKQSVNDYVSSSGEQLDINVEKFTTWEGAVTKSVDAVSGKVDGLAAKIGSVNASLGTLGESTSTGAPNTTPTEARAGGGNVRKGQTVWTGEEGMELFTAPQAGSIINAANSSTLMRALSLIGIGGGGNTYNTFNINNTANTQSVAQADAFGYRTSRQIRGFT